MKALLLAMLFALSISPGLLARTNAIKRVTIQGKDLELTDVFGRLAKVSELNIVLTDQVKGRVSLNLRNIPWDEAIDNLIKVNHLKAVRQGNALTISR